MAYDNEEVGIGILNHHKEKIVSPKKIKLRGRYLNPGRIKTLSKSMKIIKILKRKTSTTIINMLVMIRTKDQPTIKLTIIIKITVVLNIKKEMSQKTRNRISNVFHWKSQQNILLC